jgi:hypothetical protein
MSSSTLTNTYYSLNWNSFSIIVSNDNLFIDIVLLVASCTVVVLRWIAMRPSASINKCSSMKVWVFEDLEEEDFKDMWDSFLRANVDWELDYDSALIPLNVDKIWKIIYNSTLGHTSGNIL